MEGREGKGESVRRERNPRGKGKGREGKGRGGEGRGGEGRGEVRALARGVVNINCT